MLLKRLYKKDPNGLKSPVVVGVVVKRLPANGIQKFSTRLVKQGETEGWLRKEDDAIILIDGLVKEIRFEIVLDKGKHCLHCDAKLEDDQTGESARAHIQDKHAGKTSPDANYPAGYVSNSFYITEVK